MRQVVVSSFYSSRGGMSVFVKSVFEHTDATKIETYLLSEDVSDIDRAGRVIKVSDKNKVFSFFSLLTSLISLKPDHIQAHGRWYLNLCVCMYASFCILIPGFKRPVIYIVKHTDLGVRSFKAQFFRFIDLCFDRVYFPSVFFMNKNIKDYVYPAEKCFVVYPGVPRLPECDGNISDYFPESKKTITYVGKFILPGKVQGLLDLIDAFALASKARDDLFLLIMGEGELETKVRDKLRELGFNEDKVRVLSGFVASDKFYELSSLHCHISYGDSFGLVVLEALSMGKNVLVNDVADFHMFKDVPGLHCVKDDIDEIACAILNLVDKDVLTGKSSIVDCFSWFRTAEVLGAYND